MKKVILLTLVLSSFAFTNAQDSKWTIQGDSGFEFISMDGFSGGAIDLTALYSLSDKLQVGASLGLNFGTLTVHQFQLLQDTFWMTPGLHLQKLG